MTRKIYIYFTRQTCLTLPNVFDTSTFYQTQTNKQKNIYFLDSFNVQKGLGKIIHIKQDQAFVFKIAENIVFFFFAIDQFPKALIFVKGLSIS